MSDSGEQSSAAENPQESGDTGYTTIDGAESDPTRMADASFEVDDDEDLEAALACLLPSSRKDAMGRIGEYDVLSVEGRGGMGIVLKALDNGLNRIVAVKLPKPQLASSRKFRERFLREGRSVAAISHPNVLTIHAVGQHKDLPYLVMEYISGRTLRERIALGTPLLAADIARIGAQMSEGLDAAHRRGVIHRDIKPSNIMLENGVERVKITDFGLARAALDQSGLTSMGHVVGTPAFMAPEQLRDGKADVRSDLFSLGCVLYAMVSGHSPFRGSHTLEIIHKVSELTPPGLQEVEPSLPSPLPAIVSRLLEKDPDRRHQSAADVAAELTHLIMRLELESQHSTPLPGGETRLPDVSVDAPGSQRRRWPVAVAIAALIVVATSPLWFPDGDGSAPDGNASGPGTVSDPVATVPDGPASDPESPPDTRTVDQRAAEWVLSMGGEVVIALDGRERTITPEAALPEGDITLVAIDLSGNDVAATEGLAPLAGLAALRDLTLYDVPIRDDDLAHVAGLAALERLDLYHARITDYGLEHLSGLEHLQSLSIHNTAVSSDGLAWIAGLRELEALNLAQTAVTDGGLRHLSGLTGLRWLQLSGTGVTDAGLGQLTGLHSLSELYLQQTVITPGGAASLEAALPDCRIHVDEPRQEGIDPQ